MWIGVVSLLPERDVIEEKGRYFANSAEPWLRVECPADALSGQWVQLVYDSSLIDQVVRPILRCVTANQDYDQILPAATLGRAIWIGKIPEGTTAILISPFDRVAPFSFRIVELSALSKVDRIKIGGVRRAHYTIIGTALEATGSAYLGERMLRRALMGTPINAYSAWREVRRRSPDWEAFDKIPDGNERRRHIRFLLLEPDPKVTSRWLERLERQAWANWSLAGSSEEAHPRVVPWDLNAGLEAGLRNLQEDDLVAIVQSGDDWMPEALAVVGSTALREDYDVYYGDEESGGIDSRPRLKPSWSPILARSVNLVGRAWFARVDWLRRNLVDVASSSIPVSSADKVKHIPRVLLRGDKSERIKVANPPPGLKNAGGAPVATIIIPTKDRVGLLQRCVDSVIATTKNKNVEIIIVDNGSESKSAKAYLKKLEADKIARVIVYLDAFNFSAMCNLGAKSARSDTFVFLNNDTQAISEDWLESLVAWT